MSEPKLVSGLFALVPTAVEQSSTVLEKAAEERTKLLREVRQEGRSLEDLSQAEIEDALAFRLFLPLVRVRVTIIAGLKSADDLTRSQAQLVGGLRRDALATATGVVHHPDSAVWQRIAAERVIAQVHFEKAEYALAVAACQRLLALISRKEDSLAWQAAHDDSAYMNLCLAQQHEAARSLPETIANKIRELPAGYTGVSASLQTLSGFYRAQGKLSEIESLLRRQLLIMFLHRQLVGNADEEEQAMLDIYTFHLEKMHRTPAQIAADIHAIKREAGLVE